MRKMYFNGNIISMDRKYSGAEVVVTDNDYIIGVGDKSLIDSVQDCEVIDLKGNTLIPGFVVSSNVSEENLIKNGITSVIVNNMVNFFNKINGYIYSEDFPNVSDAHNNSIYCGNCITLDGNLWEKKAYLSYPYSVVPDGELLSYSGVGNYKYIEIKKFINECAKRNISMKVFVNGSAAIEQFLSAYEKLYANGKLADIRCVISGCETVTEKQLARMRMLKIIVEFPIWTIYKYGDFYRNSVLGESNLKGVSPLNTCAKTGLPFTLNIGSYSVLETIQFSVERRTSNNFLFDKSQRITTLRALKSVTVNGALSIGRFREVGSITPNKKADFVILNGNPCGMSKGNIGQIEIIETIKNGETIYKK